MKNIMKLVALVLALALLPVSAFAAEFNAPGEYPICKETVKLTVGIPDNIRIEDYETNVMTKKLEEYGNFDLDFVIYDSTDYTTKINLMMMAGGSELPDVILFDVFAGTKVTDNQLYSWAQTGSIIPLTQYYNDPSISYWLHEAVERTGVDFTKQITSPDGEIYAIPIYNQSYGNEYPCKMYYYKPWLEKLGKEAPTTLDEYRDLLKAVVSTDLNGNGKADEVGLAGTGFNDKYYNGWFEALMNCFVYAGDSDYFTVNDGVVGAAYTTEEWKEGLKYIRDMIKDGLIATESLTMDRNQLDTLANVTETALFSAVNYSMVMITMDNPARDEYTYLLPLIGPHGYSSATFEQSVANPAFVVSANCKEPEAAFRLGDLMTTEYISIMQRYGAEGVDWDYVQNSKVDMSSYVPYVDGFDLSIIAYDDENFGGGTSVTNSCWRQMGPYVRQYAIANGKAINKDTVTGFMTAIGQASMAYQKNNTRPAEVIPKLVYDTAESEQISEILVTLTSYVEEMTSNFLAGNVDIDAGWDSFQSELKAIGVDTVLSVVQQVYDRMYK